MRLLSVDKIPEVIEELGKEASKLTRRIQEKTKEVRELAEAIKGKTPSLAERALAGEVEFMANAVAGLSFRDVDLAPLRSALQPAVVPKTKPTKEGGK
jgi:hypothetical protein